MIPITLLFTVIDRWVEPRRNSSARLCDTFSQFWLFTSRIWKKRKTRKHVILSNRQERMKTQAM